MKGPTKETTQLRLLEGQGAQGAVHRESYIGHSPFLKGRGMKGHTQGDELLEMTGMQRHTADKHHAVSTCERFAMALASTVQFADLVNPMY